MVVRNLKIKWRGNKEWWPQGERGLGDFVSAIRREHVAQAIWGEFHLVETLMGGRRFYSLWLGDTMYLGEDLDELLPLIKL